MLKAYTEQDETVYIIETLQGNEVVCSREGGEEGEKFFFPLDSFRNTEKIQEKYKETTEKIQGKDSEKTGVNTSKYSKNTGMEKAREALPAPPTLKQEISVRWPLFVIMSKNETFSESSIRSFSELIDKMKTGEIKNVPRPVLHSVNKAANVNVSLDYLTRSVKLYMQYAKQRPPRWLVAIDSALNSVDRLLNLFIFKTIL